MGLKSAFDSLKNTIIGSKTNTIDNSLDKAVKDITSYKTQTGRLGYIELIKSMINKQGSNFINLQQSSYTGSAPNPAMFGQSSRLSRYKAYEAIVSKITYCYRSVNVITDNILSPDDITKRSLDVKPQSYLEDEVITESKTKMVEEIIKQIKLEDNLDLIIKNVLVYGDFFVELGTAKSALTSRAYLAEAFTNYNSFDDNNLDRLQIENKDTNSKLNIILDYSSYNESKSDGNDDKNLELSELKLLFHEPRCVVRLQSEMFPICFGYLIFPRNPLNFGQMGDQQINDICLSILKNIENKIPETTGVENSKELQDIVRSLINNSQPGYGKQLNIRFVPPDKIQHFRIPSNKFYPYGESIFDSVSFTAKMLISLQTALTVQRLNRSTEKRVIGYEIGLSRDARKMIEDAKETFRKRKVSLDSFGTVDTIPSMITTFEDIYLPQKDGKRFIDISTLNDGVVDVRSKVDELKMIRDQLIASLNVPPSFLGIEENINAKATLTNENVLFARSIICHQKYLSKQIVDLIQKVLQLLNPEEALNLLDNISINLPSPKSLQFEMLSRKINDIVSLIESLERIGVPKEYTKKKYLEDIDWDEVQNYQIDSDIDKKLGITPKEEEQGFGGGGSFGGMSGGI